jgi:hypothetical protein
MRVALACLAAIIFCNVAQLPLGASVLCVIGAGVLAVGAKGWG